MGALRPNAYAFIAHNRKAVSSLYRLTRGRGLIVNASKDRIESSFRNPVFPSSEDDLRRLLISLHPLGGRHPAVHMTHSRYRVPPGFFGDEGKRESMDFFLDIDGRRGLGPARIVTASMMDELARLDVPSWAKFSGSSGFHIHIPSTAFPKTIDGQAFPSVAPRLFLQLKHFLIRTAHTSCRGALRDSVIHPKHYYGTSQGIQRMPFSRHETTGLVALPLRREEIRGFQPQDANIRPGDELDDRLSLIAPPGSAEGLLPLLEEEGGRRPPLYHRR